MKKNRIQAILFGLYCILMLYLLFNRMGYEPGIPYREQLKYNLVPFRTIQLFLDALQTHTYRTAAVINLLGNVVMFVPLGFFLPRVFPWLAAVWKTMIAVIVIIVAVEVLQLLTLLGTCDIDDLILNLIGAFLGYVTHICIQKSLSN